MSADVFVHLAFELRRKVDALRRDAGRLEVKDYPTGTPLLLIKLIGASLDIIEAISSKLVPTEPDHLQRLRGLHTLVNIIGAHHRYVERSVTPNTPWSMVSCLEDFFRNVAGVSSVFLVRPMWNYNYAIIPNLNKYYETLISGQLDGKPVPASLGELPDINIVSFPYQERLNVVLHCCLGHEMGHTFWSEWAKDHLKALSATAQQRVAAHYVATQDPAAAAQAIKLSGPILKRGLEETLADLVGAHLLGPSALFATFEFAMTREMDTVPSSPYFYPCWRFRIRQMAAFLEDELDLLKNGDWNSVEGQCPKPVSEESRCYAEWVSEIRKIALSREDSAAMQGQPVLEIVYEIVEREIPRIMSWLKTSKAGLRYSLRDEKGLVLQLVSMLRNHLPPVESGQWPDVKRADFRSILNAACLSKLLRIDGLIDKDQPAIEAQGVADLLTLKAIESSHVQQRFGSLVQQESQR